MREIDSFKNKKEGERIVRDRSPESLFWFRFRTYIQQQKKALATVVDWVIMLYILIPGLFIGGGVYLDFWTDPLPGWLAWIPLSLFAVIIWFLYSGHVLLYIEDADVLFLRQQEKWMKKIKMRGVLVSMLISILKGCLLSLFILPFLVRNYDLPYDFWISFFVFIAFISCVSNLARRILHVKYNGWRGTLLSICTDIAAILCIIVTTRNEGFILGIAGIPFIVMLIILFGWLLSIRVHMHGTFMRDVTLDNKLKMGLTGKLISHAVEKPTKNTNKTWLFTKSQQIYKGNPEKRLASSGIKAFLRKKENLKMYFQISFIGIPAVWMPPLYVKIIIFVLILFMTAYWLFTRWSLFTSSDYIKILSFTDYELQSGGIRAVRSLYTFPVVLLAASFGLSMYPNLYGVLLTLALAIVTVWIVPGITMIAAYRQK